MNTLQTNHFSAIQYLDLESNDIGDEGVRYINEGLSNGSFKSLKRLNLSNTGITSDSLRVFSLSIKNEKCVNLETLILDCIYIYYYYNYFIDNELGVKGIEYLYDAIQSGFMKQLKDLSLNGTKLDMNAFIILSNSFAKSVCPSLKSLSVKSIIIIICNR